MVVKGDRTLESIEDYPAFMFVVIYSRKYGDQWKIKSKMFSSLDWVQRFVTRMENKYIIERIVQYGVDRCIPTKTLEKIE